MFNEFEMTKITFKAVKIFVLRTCKIVPIKPCKNREVNSDRSQFSFTDIVITRKMKFLPVITQPSIYHG